ERGGDERADRAHPGGGGGPRDRGRAGGGHRGEQGRRGGGRAYRRGGRRGPRRVLGPEPGLHARDGIEAQDEGSGERREPEPGGREEEGPEARQPLEPPVGGRRRDARAEEQRDGGVEGQEVD